MFNEFKSFSKQACEGEDLRGCTLKAIWEYENEEDKKGAFDLAQKTCDKGYPFGCLVLGYFYGDGQAGERSVPKSKELIETSCQAGMEIACSLLGELYLDGDEDFYIDEDASKRKCFNVIKIPHMPYFPSLGQWLFGALGWCY